MASIPKKPRGGQRVKRPKTLAQYRAKTPRSQAAIENVAHAITRMREGYSLKSAAAEYNVTPRTVVRLGKSALRKRADGHYAARSSDRLLRVLVVPAHDGLREVAVRDSKTAAQIGGYWSAVSEFLGTGDATTLRKFRGKSFIDASGRPVRFLVDLDALERQGSAGIFSFESVYSRRA
jgi:hypothetical protein